MWKVGKVGNEKGGEEFKSLDSGRVRKGVTSIPPHGGKQTTKQTQPEEKGHL